MKSGRVVYYCLVKDLIKKHTHDMAEFSKAASNYQIKDLCLILRKYSLNIP